MVSFLEYARWLEYKGHKKLSYVFRYSPWGLLEMGADWLMKKAGISEL